LPKILFTIALIFGINGVLFSQPSTWQKNFHLINSDDEGWAICAADGNNILVGGLTSESPMGFVMKLNQFGDTLWKKLYPDAYYTTSMVSLNDGGCIFSANAYLRRMDSEGNIVWAVEAPQYNNMLITSDNFLITPSYGNYSKYDLNGNIIWTKNISGFPSFSEAIESYEGGYLLIGSLNYKAFLIKTDTSGIITFRKQFYYSNTSYFSDIIRKNNNYLLLGGYNGNTDSTKKFILKINQDCDSLFFKNIFTNFDAYRSNILSLDNKIYLFYNYFSRTSFKEGFIIASYDTNFNLLKKVLFEPLGHYTNFNDAIFFPGSNNTRIAISGITAINGISNEDIYVASVDTSLTPLIGIEPISNNIPESFELYQNYPNPFNPVTTIRFSIPPGAKSRNELTTLKIYDILGKEISVPVNELLAPGEYEITWDAHNYPSGVYFCSLNHGSSVFTVKVVLLK